MSTATSSTEHAPEGGGHAHPKWLQHHFDTPTHQFETAKLGMWIFICTEILMFGGLFVAYGLFRNQEPEIFIQDNPTVGSLFTHDKVTYKIRHVYGGNVVEFRGLWKSVL